MSEPRLTKIELARLIAKRTKPRFIDIPRIRRHTAAENTLRQLKEKRQKDIAEKGSAVLEAELQRLIRTWSEQ